MGHITYVAEHAEAATCPRLHVDAERALHQGCEISCSSILILRVCRDSRICMFLPLTTKPIIVNGGPTETYRRSDRYGSQDLVRAFSRIHFK